MYRQKFYGEGTDLSSARADSLKRVQATEHRWAARGIVASLEGNFIYSQDASGTVRGEMDVRFLSQNELVQEVRRLVNPDDGLSKTTAQRLLHLAGVPARA